MDIYGWSAICEPASREQHWTTWTLRKLWAIDLGGQNIPKKVIKTILSFLTAKEILVGPILLAKSWHTLAWLTLNQRRSVTKVGDYYKVSFKDGSCSYQQIGQLAILVPKRTGGGMLVRMQHTHPNLDWTNHMSQLLRYIPDWISHLGRPSHVACVIGEGSLEDPILNFRAKELTFANGDQWQIEAHSINTTPLTSYSGSPLQGLDHKCQSTMFSFNTEPASIQSVVSEGTSLMSDSTSSHTCPMNLSHTRDSAYIAAQFARHRDQAKKKRANQVHTQFLTHQLFPKLALVQSRRQGSSTTKNNQGPVVTEIRVGSGRIILANSNGLITLELRRRPLPLNLPNVGLVNIFLDGNPYPIAKLDAVQLDMTLKDFRSMMWKNGVLNTPTRFRFRIYSKRVKGRTEGNTQLHQCFPPQRCQYLHCRMSRPFVHHVLGWDPSTRFHGHCVFAVILEVQNEKDVESLFDQQQSISAACTAGDWKALHRMLQQLRINGEKLVTQVSSLECGDNIELGQYVGLGVSLATLTDRSAVHGFSGLHCAAKSGSEKCLQLLMQSLGPYVDEGFLLDGCGRSPLHYAAAKGHVLCIKLLLQWPPALRLLNAGDLLCQTALFMAVNNGAIMAALLLVNANADVSVPDVNGTKAIDLASACIPGVTELARTGQYKKLETLLEAMKMESAQEPAPETFPLDPADQTHEHTVYMMRLKIRLTRGRILVGLGVKLTLTEHGQAVTNMFRTSALHEAACYGHTEAVRVLLSVPRVDVNAQDIAGKSPLHHAIQNPSVVTLLLNAKANPAVFDSRGHSPLDLCMLYGTDTCRNLLLDAMTGEELLQQSSSGHCVIKTLLRISSRRREMPPFCLKLLKRVPLAMLRTSATSFHRTKPRVPTLFGFCPSWRHWSLSLSSTLTPNLDQLSPYFHLDLLSSTANPADIPFPKRGSNIDLVIAAFENDVTQPPLLFHVVKTGNMTGLEILLHAGADPNSVDENGYSALYFAFQCQRRAVFERLLKGGASVDLPLPGDKSLAWEMLCQSWDSELPIMVLQAQKRPLHDCVGMLEYLKDYHQKHFGDCWRAFMFQGRHCQVKHPLNFGDTTQSCRGTEEAEVRDSTDGRTACEAYFLENVSALCHWILKRHKNPMEKSLEVSMILQGMARILPYIIYCPFFFGCILEMYSALRQGFETGPPSMLKFKIDMTVLEKPFWMVKRHQPHYMWRSVCTVPKMEPDYEPPELLNEIGLQHLEESLICLLRKDWCTGAQFSEVFHDLCYLRMWRAAWLWFDLFSDQIYPTATKRCSTRNALHMASAYGTDGLVASILKQGQFNVNVFSQEDLTPVHYACMAGHMGVLELLLGRGADPEAISSKYHLPSPAYHYAIANPDEDQSLVQKGLAPVHFAARYGHLDALKFLLDHGVCIHRKDKGNDNPLLHAIARGHSETAILVMENKVDPWRVNKLGISANVLAASNGNITLCHDIVNFANESWLWLSVNNTTGESIAHYGALLGSNIMTQQILNIEGVLLDQKEESSATSEVVEHFLLPKSADLYSSSSFASEVTFETDAEVVPDPLCEYPFMQEIVHGARRQEAKYPHRFDYLYAMFSKDDGELRDINLHTNYHAPHLLTNSTPVMHQLKDREELERGKGRESSGPQRRGSVVSSAMHSPQTKVRSGSGTYSSGSMSPSMGMSPVVGTMERGKSGRFRPKSPRGDTVASTTSRNAFDFRESPNSGSSKNRKGSGGGRADTERSGKRSGSIDGRMMLMDFSSSMKTYQQSGVFDMDTDVAAKPYGRKGSNFSSHSSLGSSVMAMTEAGTPTHLTSAHRDYNRRETYQYHTPGEFFSHLNMIINTGVCASYSGSIPHLYGLEAVKTSIEQEIPDRYRASETFITPRTMDSFRMDLESPSRVPAFSSRSGKRSTRSFGRSVHRASSRAPRSFRALSEESNMMEAPRRSIDNPEVPVWKYEGQISEAGGHMLFGEANILFNVALETMQAEGDEEKYPGLIALSLVMQKIDKDPTFDYLTYLTPEVDLCNTFNPNSDQIVNKFLHNGQPTPRATSALFTVSDAYWTPLNYARAMGNYGTCNLLKSLGAQYTYVDFELLANPFSFQSPPVIDTSKLYVAFGAALIIAVVTAVEIQEGYTIADNENKVDKSFLIEPPPLGVETHYAQYLDNVLDRHYAAFAYLKDETSKYHYQTAVSYRDVGATLANYRKYTYSYNIDDLSNSEQLLLKYSYGPQACYAAALGWTHRIEKLACMIPDINFRDPNGFNLLCHAVWNRQTDMVETLLSLGADPCLANYVDVGRKAPSAKVSPLNLACVRGYVAIAHLLLKAKSPVDCRDWLNHTPLEVAIFNSNVPLTALLLWYDADIHIHSQYSKNKDQNAKFRTPYLLAIFMGEPIIIRLVHYFDRVHMRIKRHIELLANPGYTWKGHSDPDPEIQKLMKNVVDDLGATDQAIHTEARRKRKGCSWQQDGVPRNKVSFAIRDDAGRCSAVALMYIKFCEFWNCAPLLEIVKFLNDHIWPVDVRSMAAPRKIQYLEFMALLDVVGECIQLEYLDLSSGGITKEGVEAMVNEVKVHPSLKRLNLRENLIVGTQYYPMLKNMVKTNTNLVEVDLHGTSLTVPEQRSISSMASANARQRIKKHRGPSPKAGSPKALTRSTQHKQARSSVSAEGDVAAQLHSYLAEMRAESDDQMKSPKSTISSSDSPAPLLSRSNKPPVPASLSIARKGSGSSGGKTQDALVRRIMHGTMYDSFESMRTAKGLSPKRSPDQTPEMSPVSAKLKYSFGSFRLGHQRSVAFSPRSDQGHPMVINQDSPSLSPRGKKDSFFESGKHQRRYAAARAVI